MLTTLARPRAATTGRSGAQAGGGGASRRSRPSPRAAAAGADGQPPREQRRAGDVALDRRLLLSLGPLATLAASLPASAGPGDVSGPYCDFTQTLPCDPYPNYVSTPSGLLYQELRFGEGEAVRPGEQVTVDWDGYTFYLQHVIKARNLAKVRARALATLVSAGYRAAPAK